MFLFHKRLCLPPRKLTWLAGKSPCLIGDTSSFTVVFPLSNVSKLGGGGKIPWKKPNLFRYRYPAMLIQLETFETSNSCRVQELDVPGTRVDFLTRCLVSAPWCAFCTAKSGVGKVRKGPYFEGWSPSMWMFWGYFRCYHLYTANWGIICHLPPFRGPRNNHWSWLPCYCICSNQLSIER